MYISHIRKGYSSQFSKKYLEISDSISLVTY